MPERRPIIIHIEHGGERIALPLTQWCPRCNGNGNIGLRGDIVAACAACNGKGTTRTPQADGIRQMIAESLS